MEFIAYYARRKETDNILHINTHPLSVGDCVVYKDELNQLKKEIEGPLEQELIMRFLALNEKYGYIIYNKLDDVFSNSTLNDISIYKVRITHKISKYQCSDGDIVYFAKGFEVLDIAYRDRPCPIYHIENYIEEEERNKELLNQISKEDEKMIIEELDILSKLSKEEENDNDD